MKKVIKLKQKHRRKDGSVVFEFNQVPKKYMSLLYKEAIKSNLLTVKDLLFQDPTGKRTLKENIVSAMIVKKLEIVAANYVLSGKKK
jgi:hypothetical protein